MTGTQRLASAAALAALLLLASGAATRAQSPGPLLIGMGDSIGEGVQSADASVQSQPYSFIHIVSLLMGAPMPLPYIETGLFGAVGSVDGRSRQDASVEGLNLAVSGADLGSLLTGAADAASAGEVDDETNLVLCPRLGSQMEIAEGLQPQRVAIWIGNNDALSAVTDFDQLDGVSQLTPIGEFATRFIEIASRLAAMGSQVVFGTIPDVTKIAFLVDAEDLERLTGNDHGLPAGSYTTLVTATGIALDLVDPIVLTSPDFVLEPAEIANVNLRIDEFNDVIRYVAAAYGMDVADVAVLFDTLAASPPVLAGVPLSTKFLGGFFSLDGVHPSNMGQLIVAMLFVDAFNQQYGLAIPGPPPDLVVDFFLNDPFIDKDGDGQVAGRFGAGLLGTVSLLLGWSGEAGDAVPSAAAANTGLAVDLLEALRGGAAADSLEVLSEMFEPGR